MLKKYFLVVILYFIEYFIEYFFVNNEFISYKNRLILIFDCFCLYNN